MTEPLTVENVPIDRLEQLMAKGTLVSEEALAYTAEKMGPDSAPALVQKKIKELAVPHLRPVVVFEEENGSLTLLWVERKEDDDAEGKVPSS